MRDFRAWRAPRRTGATEVIVVAVLYCATASLSLRLAFEKTNASPVWPPSGIALVAVLLLGYRVWPGIMLGAFAANVVTFLTNQAAGVLATVTISSVIGIGNTLEAVVGKSLLDRLVGARSPLDRAPDVFKFAAVALLACLVSASVGPTVIALAGMAPSGGYATVWFTWWLGDAAGVLLVAPLLITWLTQPRLEWAPRKRIEAAVLFLSLLIGVHVGFGGWLHHDAHYPLPFVPLPWLVWSAFRFGPREAATAAAVTSGIAVWNTVSGLGPFVRDTVNESLLLVQAFVGLVTVTILTMAALVAERRDAHARLRTAHDTLEERVDARTQALAQVNERLQGEIAERRAAEATAETRRRETEVLADLARRINASLDLDAVLQVMAECARELAASDMAGIMLREPASGAMTPRYVTGHRPEAGWTRLRIEAGKGLGGQVLLTGRPWRTDDYLADPHFSKDYLDHARAEGIVAAIVVPIPIERGIEGLVYIANRSPRPFGDTDETMLVRLAEHAAIAIRNAQLFREVAHRRETAEHLADVGRQISQSLDPHDVAQRIAESVRALLGVPVAVVYRLEPASGHLVAIGLVDAVGRTFAEQLTFPVGTGGVGRAVRERRVVTSLNVLEDPEIILTPDLRSGVEQAGYRAVLALPLQVQDTIIGALAVGDRAGRVFAPEEIELVRAFANQAAIALENARLYERAQQAYDELSRVQAELLQTQKMEAIGRLAAGVAHDFNNLLTVIRGRSQLVLTQLASTNPLWRDVELIQTTCDRAAGVVEQLLAFGRKQILQPKVLDLSAVVGGMTAMLRRLIGEDIELVFVPAPELGRVRADAGQLEQVIVNLAVNARDAMPDGGRWTIEAANVDLGEGYARRHVGVRSGAYVRLSVSDTGVGMDETTRARLFEPFFTTKEVGKGSGLGLATVYGIVKQSGGNILVYSEVGYGTTFKIYLPQVHETADTVASAGAAKPLRGGIETVLLVEDETEVRDLTREILEGLGYTVLEASRPREAMLVSEQFRGPIHLLLTDVVMPELNGNRLAVRLTSGRAEMKVLYMSGYTDDAIARHGVLEPGTRLLQKPFSRETLADKVRDVLDETRDG